MSYYFNSIVEITLPITVFICLMLLLAPFVKKILVVKWRYYVWLFTALRLLMPCGVRILKPIIISLPPEMTEVDFSVFSKGTENVNALSLGNIVFYVWLSFSVCFLIVNVVIGLADKIGRLDVERNSFRADTFGKIKDRRKRDGFLMKGIYGEQNAIDTALR